MGTPTWRTAREIQRSIMRAGGVPHGGLEWTFPRKRTLDFILDMHCKILIYNSELINICGHLPPQAIFSRSDLSVICRDRASLVRTSLDAPDQLRRRVRTSS